MRKKRLSLLIALCITALLLQGCKNYLDEAIYEVIQDGQIDSNESASIIVDFRNESHPNTEDEMVARIMNVAQKKGVNIDSVIVRMALFPQPQTQKNINVKVYLDNTMSMEGYSYAKSAESFTKVFAGIKHYYDANQKASIKGYYVKKGNVIDTVDYNLLLSQLTHKTIPFTDSYQLDEFLVKVVDEIKEKQNSSEVICFFVTDGIPSGTNEEIKKNGSFNLDSRAILKSRIAEPLRVLSNGKFAVALYGFEANFNGIYYNYKNVHIPPGITEIGKQPWKEDILRPFYVIALGDSELVKDFYESVNSGLQDFAPVEELLFTEMGKLDKPYFVDPTGESYSISKGSRGCQRQNIMDYSPYPYTYVDFHGDSSDTIFVTKNPYQDKTKIEFYFKKKDIPSYLQNQLESALSIMYGDDIVPFIIDGNKVKFALDVTNGKTTVLSVKVRDELPKWVENRNSLSDEKFSVLNHDTKTLNLAVLIQGLHDGIFNTEGRVYLMEKKFIVVDVEDKEF